MQLEEVLDRVLDGIRAIDVSGEPYRSAKPPFREYQPGVGPYSEAQIAKRIAARLAAIGDPRFARTCTRREPDLFIPDHWAIELKLARPFGDNGKEAEHWSQNLLHPYAGNVSALADCLKLCARHGTERRAVVVVGYEHADPLIALDPLIRSFEILASGVMSLRLGPRLYREAGGLIHPVHQRVRVWAWEVIGRVQSNITS